MKSSFLTLLAVLLACALLQGCGAKRAKNEITAETAYEGVSNYCRETYDWSIAEENPDIMSLEMGEETETAYQVVFRSYTGAFVYFEVDKATGMTKLTESVPTLGIESDAGSIDLHEYLKPQG